MELELGLPEAERAAGLLEGFPAFVKGPGGLEELLELADGRGQLEVEGGHVKGDGSGGGGAGGEIEDGIAGKIGEIVAVAPACGEKGLEFLLCKTEIHDARAPGCEEFRNHACRSEVEGVEESRAKDRRI
jgi:hypothetical protein